MNRSKRARFIVAVIVGAIAGAFGLALASKDIAILAALDSMALTLLIELWFDFHGLGPKETARVARHDDMGKAWLDSVVLTASLASVVAVGVLLTLGETNNKSIIRIAFGLFSIILSWATVHAIYTLRYAVMYYNAPEGGINFNEKRKPRFIDFAYVSYTIGMTYQVSDTTISQDKFRGVMFRHALISFLFGTAIIATTINLIISLSS